MGDFTYEKEDRKSVLEKYEWDNTWIENTDNSEGMRVLYIGDSISCAARRIATKLTEEKFLFDGFASSKAVDNPFFKESIALFASQLPKTDLILFNNGLHGFHLDDNTQYAKYYEEMVSFLLKEYPDIPLILLLTTCVRNTARAQRVEARNNAVLNIAKKYNLPTVDLYTPTNENKDLISEDGVHLTDEGYEFIAKEIINVIEKTC